MTRARPLDTSALGREAAGSASRPTPLIVSGAVAGDDLESVAGSASDAIGHPIAIVLPALGEPVVWPRGAIAAEGLQAIAEQAKAAISGTARSEPAGLLHPVLIRIGDEVAGIVAAVPADDGNWRAEHRAWVEAAAAAAAVAALMRDTHQGEARALVEALRAGPPADVAGFAQRARKLGVDLGGGAVAVCVRGGSPEDLPAGLVAPIGDDRLLALVPLSLAQNLPGSGPRVAVSSPRKDPALLHDALREAELLLELAGTAEAALVSQEDTYRLLIGVLLRDSDELEQLRAATISPLREYDRRHGTELLETLQAFLAHDGSTIETADAMGLHRHTVGYRLARVQVVSGLSPYESDGRERLSLGLKADQILAATERLFNTG